MAVLTCSEKEWDKFRPASVKKTGLSDAIKQVFKALPGGDPSKLATAADCSKASKSLLAYKSVLSSAATAVGKAQDDKKGGAGKLKTWLSEADSVHGALATQEIRLVEAITAPALKKWTAPRADLEKKVEAMTADIRGADNNIGHAEEMRKEAVMSMVERAGTLREEGWDGTVVQDFQKDPAFAKMYKTWDEMVETQIKATKVIEVADLQAKQLKKLITMMKDELNETVKTAGDGLQLDSPGLRDFKRFRADAVKFYEETAGPNAAKYSTFAFIASPRASSDTRSWLTQELEKGFARIKKVDAENYFESTSAKYGLNEKRLAKTVQDVRNLGGIGEKIITSLRQQADPQRLEQLGTIVKSLAETNQRLVKGRNNMEIIQALSKDVNKDAKVTIDKGLKVVAEITETTSKAYAELR